MMPGGDPEAYKHLQPIVEKVAAQTDDGACVTYIGKGGSGEQPGPSHCKLPALSRRAAATLESRGAQRLHAHDRCYCTHLPRHAWGGTVQPSWRGAAYAPLLLPPTPPRPVRSPTRRPPPTPQPRSRRQLREDGAQRHRVRRHAADCGGLRCAARGERTQSLVARLRKLSWTSPLPALALPAGFARWACRPSAHGPLSGLHVCRWAA